MLPQFFNIPQLENRCLVVKEGDVLSLGQHQLQFIMAPMVHWPEVMMTYEQTEKVLFSADGFGKFGALTTQEDWTPEARRYYFNIVGKFGAPVQTVLKKAASLDIQTICPLHGPILTENLGFYMDKYLTWSSYQPEEAGIVIAYASIHGNTQKVAFKMADILKEKTVLPITLIDLTRDDLSYAVSAAFTYSHLILAAASYDGGVFPPMEDFLNRLAHKGYQNRHVGLIENASWAPTAAKTMKQLLSTMKAITLCDQVVTVDSTLKSEHLPAMSTLADQILS